MIPEYEAVKYDFLMRRCGLPLDLLGQKRDVKTSGFVYVDKCQLTLRRVECSHLASTFFLSQLLPNVKAHATHLSMTEGPATSPVHFHHMLTSKSTYLILKLCPLVWNRSHQVVENYSLIESSSSTMSFI
ncbi:uncharacterized protein CLUP02_13780 [Colletotrichum lupini]|uniref:Uncharacterized protein n=1 Tax=Colletotrichum lupini TaxID=145971 RepID=A0A9Q8T350_9PEZI|nr:uncharacterized protein CLUP02_13780 [Colletotrichum lupini]UQC88257.1 hypothetical protein CLUP02_13780 [Colletotrichum lupini]